MIDPSLLALAAILTLPLDILAAAAFVAAIRGRGRTIYYARRGGAAGATDEELRQIGACMASQRGGVRRC